MKQKIVGLSITIFLIFPIFSCQEDEYYCSLPDWFVHSDRIYVGAELENYWRNLSPYKISDDIIVFSANTGCFEYGGCQYETGFFFNIKNKTYDEHCLLIDNLNQFYAYSSDSNIWIGNNYDNSIAFFDISNESLELKVLKPPIWEKGLIDDLSDRLIINDKIIVSLQGAIDNEISNYGDIIAILDQATGNILWENTFSNYEYHLNDFIVNNNVLIFFDNHYQLQGYDINTYNKIFEFDLSKHLNCSKRINFRSYDSDTILFIDYCLREYTHSPEIQLFDYEELKIKWTVKLEDIIYAFGLPIILNDKIYVSSESIIYCFSSNGDLLWQFAAEKYVDSCLLGCDRYLFTNISNTAYIFDADTGDVIGKCDYPHLFKKGLFIDGNYYEFHINENGKGYIDIYKVEGSTCSMEYSPNQIYYSDE